MIEGFQGAVLQRCIDVIGIQILLVKVRKLDGSSVAAYSQRNKGMDH